ncbi:FlhC family transcriptional regulator [Ferrovum sp.]|uniref:FlhC family transcriptional regulator n=1 Tax=Ferrovum sp. TaxID=2609467 RepID=UPI002622218F|nr:FlhC family transcriptional regulator [Ferrovum sp.]
MATKRDLQQEIRRYRQAERLLELGARVPVVADLTHLSSWFLRKLSLEINGEAPRKGQIPNSDQWYLRRKHLLQSSLFCQIYSRVKNLVGEDEDGCTSLMEGYSQWRDVVLSCGLSPCLTLDRAWWLVKSLEMRHLQQCRCQGCQGLYVQPWSRLRQGYRCEPCRQRRQVASDNARLRLPEARS